MHIIAAGDLHLRDDRPKCRKDNYFATMFQKLHWIFQEAKKYPNPAIVFPGDIFDKYKVSNFLKGELIRLLLEYRQTVLCVAGQHDQEYHTKDLSNTSLGVIESTRIIRILNDSYYFSYAGKVTFYGASYGDEVPDCDEDASLNVLVIHKMISNKDYWNGHVPYTGSREFLKANSLYDLVISGDNHNSFITKFQRRCLINCGSLMRSRIDQKDHKPMIVIYDSESGKTEIKYVPIAPPEEVFKDEVDDEKKIDRANLHAFIASMKSNADKTQNLNFVENMRQKIAQLDLDEETESIIWEALKDGRKT